MPSLESLPTVSAVSPADLIPRVYLTDGDSGAEIHRCAQRDGSVKWAIRRHCDVLGRGLTWEYECQPSSRDDAFMAEFRFESLNEALTILNLHRAVNAAIAEGAVEGDWLVQYMGASGTTHTLARDFATEAEIRAAFEGIGMTGQITAIVQIKEN